MRKTTILGAAILAVAVGGVTGRAQEGTPAAGGPSITVEPLACIPSVDKDTNARIVAVVNAPFEPTSVRVYFHAEGDIYYHSAQGRGLKKEEDQAFYKDENGQIYFHPPYHEGDHYHEMKKGNAGDHDEPGAWPRPDGTEYWSTLPKVAPGTVNVVYYVSIVDPDGHQYSSTNMTVPVTTDCADPKLNSDEKKYAKNLVEGLTGEKQSAVPPGFLCDGIVSFITVNGDLKANEECRKCACGLLPVEWVASAAVLGGGVVVYNHNRGGGGGHPVSPYRP